ncbi:hypothetical protein B0A48_07996 [Cryoendolithus antarcticus]|uniref:WHI2-like protein P4H10.16c n=1 Tax=Cryoendolithus antarcticus TaxID=1507870 RepID=A0A1V8T180_9PEZI|nr:hypothetical protein B0A48_07996 [Cryoendolithus antarcticus]
MASGRTATVPPPSLDSATSSVHTTPSLRGHTPTGPLKIDVDSHFELSTAESSQPTKEESSATAAVESPPPFSAHNFPSRYFPTPSDSDPYRALVTACQDSQSLTALAGPPAGPAPPFEETEQRSPSSAFAVGEGPASSVVADTKAALPRDTKDRQLDDGEPPPPYTEGSSPLDGFTYVMSSAGSIITQVQQGGPAPLNTALGGSDENITLDLRGTRFTLSRDELLTLPEFVLLSLFPNGLLPDGQNNFHEGDVYPVDYDPTSLSYMLDFFRQVAQTIPQSSEDSAQEQSSHDPLSPSPMPIEPMAGNARDMLQDRAGIIVLREDLDFYAIPPRKDIEQHEVIEVKRAAGRALLRQDGIFSGLRKSEEPGTTEQHLIEMLTAGGFDHADSWGHRAAEPNKAVICSIALARLRTDIRGEAANSNAVGMAQKLLLFWRKPARRCWWEGVELDNVEGVEGKLKVWIRRVWTLEMSVIGLR